MFTLFFFSFILSLCESARAQVRFAPIEGQYQAKAEFQYLTTSANYNSGGSSTSLFGGTKLTRMLGVGEATYDYSPALRFWGGFSGGQTSAVVVDTLNSFISTVTKTQTNSGMAEGWLGGQWWTEFHKFDIVPQLDFVIPFARVNTASADPLLGEGALRMQAGSWAFYPSGDLVPFVYAGLAYRDEGRSMLLPYSLGARFGRESQWWAQVEFRGFQSISSDSSNQLVRDAYLNYSDGGSYEFYAINPSRSEIAGMVGVRFEQFGIYAGGSKTVFGRNSADDYEIRAGLTFNGLAFNKAKKVQTPVDKFEENGEKYDDSLFREQITPPEPAQQSPAEPAAQPETPQPPAKSKVKAEPKTPQADAPMPDVELLMKETQKSLEKKKGR